MGDARAKMITSGPTAKSAMMSEAPAGSARVLYKAVVVEYLNDPSVFTPEYLEQTYGGISDSGDEEENSLPNLENTPFLAGAPRNSCIVRVISGGVDKQKAPILAYPFFPPHMCFPAKPGEQVWLISEKPDSLGELPLWICRVPENLQIDDINFTHGDRKLGEETSQTTSEKLESQEEDSENKIPKFPNGGASAGSTSLKPELGNNEETPFEEQENSYDVIVSNSKSYLDFTPEQVPRLTKRPGDLVFQGSNNTAIILGEDRGWGPDSDPPEAEFSNASAPYDPNILQKGTIDIVAGRGRWTKDGEITPTDTSTIGDDPKNTQPRLIKNARKDEVSYVEVDKNPGINNIDPVIPEGDPDLIRDCSRIYVSMKTSGDQNFGISNTNVEDSMATGFDAAIEDADDAPYVVIKSDEVRLIARKDEDNDINGSIRIVKQGTKNDDLAAIVLLPDGTIQISGSKIYLGRSTSDDGVGGGPGEGKSQPYVKYQELEDLWNAFMDEMSEFCDTLLTHTTPGYGAPSIQLNDAATTLKTNIESTHKPDIENVKSERIFGE